MSVLFLVEHGQFPLLVGKENNLVIDHRFGVRYAVDKGQQIDGHVSIVHLDIGIGPYQRGQGSTVHVHKAVHLASSVAHRNGLVVHPEIGHRDDSVLEIHGEITVHIFVRLTLVQELGLHAGIV